jgi:hypothetical protein
MFTVACRLTANSISPLRLGLLILAIGTTVGVSPMAAETIVICTGYSGHDPGYTQLVDLYEQHFPGVEVEITDDWVAACTAEHLTFLSLTGWSNPAHMIGFEDLMLFAISWSSGKRLVMIADSWPPCDPAVMNAFLSIAEAGVTIDATAHGTECGNLTGEINGAHPVMEGVGELEYGRASRLTVGSVGEWLARTADGVHDIVAVSTIFGLPGTPPCGDIVVLGDAAILSDECGALEHAGNQRLALNLFMECYGTVPVESETWGGIKAVYRH